MVCLSCGNRWKELSDGPVSLGDIWREDTNLQSAKMVIPDEMKKSHVVYGAAESPKHSWLSGVILSIGLLISGIVATTNFMEHKTNKLNTRGLKVADLQFEELVRQNLGKVVRVSGTIANTGTDSYPVTRLALILKKSNGSELTRWYYNSPVAKLAPGGKTRFVSSIHYDTPVIASVDAKFE